MVVSSIPPFSYLVAIPKIKLVIKTQTSNCERIAGYTCETLNRMLSLAFIISWKLCS